MHLQTDIPGPGFQETFNIESEGLNDKTWTNYSYTFSKVDPSMKNFRIGFVMAAGAVKGAGGSILIDNIELNPVP